ncbi:winged helix-turn-helix transcriptional regulator [Candidatus Woesearchaeota archaeon]|nr:winged helix-turn-helix transcriptional regulator [Candidatus Woesearchaeota archaeon]
MKNLIWYLLLGTRGGETRAKILLAINKKPMNANQLATRLKLDYKTIQHHVKILTDNRLLAPINNGKYGAAYFISEEMKSLWKEFGKVWAQFGNNLGKSK